RAWRRRDTGVHAGRHAGRGERGDASGPRKRRRPDSAEQHLPSVSASRGGSDCPPGGPHPFIGWAGPIPPETGGHQVFSLAERRTISEEGARFRSHLDGSAHLLTTEKATDIQAQLGSDVAMVLDECLAYPATVDAARESMHRTVRWARRARARLLELRD